MAHSTPLHHLASARNALFVRFHDWEIVDHYGLPRQEYDIVRARAGVFDASPSGILRVSGRDGPVPPRGAPLHCERAQAGTVTSAATSPRLGQPLALLESVFAGPGTSVDVADDAASYEFRLASLPLS